jgi:hypothetical protein
MLHTIKQNGRSTGCVGWLLCLVESVHMDRPVNQTRMEESDKDRLTLAPRKSEASAQFSPGGRG